MKISISHHFPAPEAARIPVSAGHLQALALIKKVSEEVQEQVELNRNNQNLLPVNPNNCGQIEKCCLQSSLIQ